MSVKEGMYSLFDELSEMFPNSRFVIKQRAYCSRTLCPEVSKDPKTSAHIPKNCKEMRLLDSLYIHNGLVDGLLQSTGRLMAFPKSSGMQLDVDSLSLFLCLPQFSLCFGGVTFV